MFGLGWLDWTDLIAVVGFYLVYRTYHLKSHTPQPDGSWAHKDAECNNCNANPECDFCGRCDCDDPNCDGDYPEIKN